MKEEERQEEEMEDKVDEDRSGYIHLHNIAHLHGYIGGEAGRLPSAISPASLASQRVDLVGVGAR